MNGIKALEIGLELFCRTRRIRDYVLKLEIY
jgi:hypothetical protein